MDVELLRALLTHAGLGIVAAVCLFLLLREHNRSKEREEAHSKSVKELSDLHAAQQKNHTEDIKELSGTLLESYQKQTEAIVQNTETIRSLRELTERIVFDHLPRYASPAQNTPTQEGSYVGPVPQSPKRRK